MSPTAMPALPPTPQEIQRKLSVHSVSRSKPTTLSMGGGVVSGTESDSDSIILTPDVSSPSGSHAIHVGGSSTQPPLTSIAERRSGSGEDTEDDEEGGEGEWKTADIRTNVRNSLDEKVLKAGYLWKKGERRKTWKKRWFVLRPAHIAYYKSSKEYQLLRLLELSDVHSCTQVNLKRHNNSFGLISPTRTFYLQTSTPEEVQDWVKAIEEARQAHLATSTQNSVTATPVPIPNPAVVPRSLSRGSTTLSSSPPQASYGGGYHPTFTSSDSEDALPPQQDRGAVSSPMPAALALSPSKVPVGAPQKDPSKVIVSGYLMKCGSKRRNWRKRWFVLTGEKLVYSGSHMDTKPHRQFAFNEILDALEYQLQSSHKQVPGGPATSVSPPQGSPEIDDVNATHTFKIVTTKRTLLLCAPSEDDEIKWLGAIRALIARRMESGQVPGKVSKSRSPETRYEGQSMGEATGVSVSPQAGGSGMSGASTSGSGRLKGKVRRMSGAAHPEQEMREAKTA
ncbi:hypothetical protein CPB83DRAFT_846830 [Crepidotus variabilis]|uniref:PH domain-containing protein n=1 Tax=Crepidotus variabilis TaxID=179855 RepID=A0A9P6EMK3_9AGAR|nr:hypothetical protein CPB83DRAFT_846830 [Crepidotus variabilis]